MRTARVAKLLLSFFCLLSFPAYVPAQQKPQIEPDAANWDALIPKIKTLLKQVCIVDDSDMTVADDSDVTADGTPLALVECRMGAYMDAKALIVLKKGEPALAKFRDGHGKPIDQDFIDGASVMHGAATILLPAEHAVVQLYWNAEEDREPTLADCAGTAYIWNRQSKTFDIDPKRSPGLVERECRRQFKDQ
jgi:hypothetical protein